VRSLGQEMGNRRGFPKRVAIFDPVGSYFSVPTLQCLLDEFQRMGIWVDLFLRFGTQHVGGYKKVTAHPFPVTFRAWSGGIRSTLRTWKWFLQCRAWRGHSELRAGEHDLIFGVNPEGAIAAYRYWKKSGIPFVYLSFEMVFRDELQSKDQLAEKNEEISASRGALFVITQDAGRGQLLCAENGLTMDRLEFLPVSSRGAAAPRRTDYLRERFKIKADKKILLHSGTFRDWTCADEVTESALKWPDNLVLVIHTHYERFGRGEDPYILGLRKLASEKVFISNRALDQSEYEEMICSADAGLVFYKPNHKPPFGGRNLEMIGLSSGKLSSYMKNGLPVICGGQVNFMALIERYRFGEYSHDFNDIPRLFNKICENWSQYSSEAGRFFAEQLDFDIHWPRIWKRIRASISTPAKCQGRG
jgi:hypothetical protein